MELSRLLSLSFTTAGSVAAARVLRRRRRWEQTHNQIAICVDYDDAYSAAIRAGLPFDEMMQLDLDYVDRWSFWLDLSLLLRTIPAVVSGRGAY